VKWAHLDIAGPAFNDGKAYGYTTSGGTGVPIRTLLTLLAELEA
jgi:leucyl aminopeptidase